MRRRLQRRAKFLAFTPQITKKGQKTVFQTENNKDFHEQKTTLRILKNTKLTLGLKVNVRVLYDPLSRQQSNGLRRSGGYRQHARGQRRRQTFASFASPSRVRWSSAEDSMHRAGVHRRVAAHKTHTRPRAALSDLSGGSGMAAGAAFAHPRAADARVRPIFLRLM